MTPNIEETSPSILVGAVIKELARSKTAKADREAIRRWYEKNLAEASALGEVRCTIVRAGRTARGRAVAFNVAVLPRPAQA